MAIATSTTILLPLWWKLCHKLIRSPSMLVHNVWTQWNSTNNMLESVLKFHSVVEAMTQNHENRLCKFELLDEDWDIITQLKDVLEVFSCTHLFSLLDYWYIYGYQQIFKQVTLLFSVKDTPNLANVIPVMDSIDNALSLKIGRASCRERVSPRV